MRTSRETYLEALSNISPDICYRDWVRVCMAAKAAELEFNDFDEWSSQGVKYDARVASSTWKSVSPDGGVTAATLFHYARERGLPSFSAGTHPYPDRSPRKPSTWGADSPTAVWQRLKPATNEHSYIEAKRAWGVPLEHLRVVPEGDPLRISGISMVGALAVPAKRADGSISTLQLIPTPEALEQLKDSKSRVAKLNLPGYRVEGWFSVGEITGEGDLYVCEGLASAWAVWMTLGRPAVSTFGCGNLGKVTKDLRRLYPSRSLVLCPDRGEELRAKEAALETDALVVEMPYDWKSNSDVWDLWDQEGADALQALLSLPRRPETRFTLLDPTDLEALPPLEWRIRGVLPARGIAAFYGASGSGKSFLAFDTACAIADGAEWFGYAVRPAPVVFCALESQEGLRLRAKAWETANNRAVPQGLRLLLEPFRLTDDADVHDLARAIRTTGPTPVIFIDTLNRATPGSDENGAADMGRIIEKVSLLQRLTEGVVVLVHHSGKDPGRGPRGHSSLYAAMDAVIEVSRLTFQRRWRLEKAKEGADGASHSFTLTEVDLGVDADGALVKSCAVQHTRAIAFKGSPSVPKGANQKAAMAALAPHFERSSDLGKSVAPEAAPCLLINRCVEVVAASLVCEEKRRVERAKEAINGLVKQGLLMQCDAWLWIP